MKNTYLLFLVSFFVSFSACQKPQKEAAAGKPTVAVSVAPYKYFVERIAGDKVHVEIVVPPGMNHHTYEPTPKHMLALTKASLWFKIGEPYELRVASVLKDSNGGMEMVSLQERLPSFEEGGHHHCAAHAHDHSHHHHDSTSLESYDVHTWLSLKNAQVQAQTIADTLGKIFPDDKEFFQVNAQGFIADLAALDAELHDLFHAKRDNCHILVSHPAYFYFCKDYGITQHALECEGREPHPQYVVEVMQKVEKEGIKTVFLQREVNDKGARRVAEILDLKMVYLDPNAMDYLDNIRKIAYHFAEECK